MLALVAEGGKIIGARSSLLFDVPSFHQKARRYLSITYPDAALLFSKIGLPKLFLKQLLLAPIQILKSKTDSPV